MKVLLDMNLSPRWRALLEREHIEAVHWSEVGPVGAEDTEIMAYAPQHDCVVLSTGPRLQHDSRRHVGLKAKRSAAPLRQPRSGRHRPKGDFRLAAARQRVERRRGPQRGPTRDSNAVTAAAAEGLIVHPAWLGRTCQTSACTAQALPRSRAFGLDSLTHSPTACACRIRPPPRAAPASVSPRYSAKSSSQ